MAARTDIDLETLQERGYVVLPDLVAPDLIDAFEAQIAAFVASQCARFGIAPRSADPFIEVFGRDRAYRKLVYRLMEELFVLQRMSLAVGQRLEDSGFLAWSGFKVPLIWPDIRADLPNDGSLLLRKHQDSASTRCHRAWRLWIPLRPADELRGTIKLLPESHLRGWLPHDAGDLLYPQVGPEHLEGLEEEVLSLPAGHGVLLNPRVVHESVPNRSERTKFTLMVQVQDLASVSDPKDVEDPLTAYTAIFEARARAREAS